MSQTSKHKSASFSREDWLSHINVCHKSGLKQAAYCREANISYSSFKYWRKMLLSSATACGEVKFVPVTTEKPDASYSDAPPKAIQIKLVSGHVVYIPTSLSMVAIGQLVRAMEGCDA